MASASKNAQIHRSSDGCWTCRLRRKKCDERRPTCYTCETLSITCHFDLQKPTWMDGGTRQEQMAEDLKRQVKAQAPFRRWNRHRDDGGPATGQDPSPTLSQQTTRSTDCNLAQLSGGVDGAAGVSKDESVLLSVYMDHVLPLLYPFYNPTPLQGGRSWIIDLFLSSPVFRQTVSCHSSYWIHQSSETTSPDNTEVLSFEFVTGQTQKSFAGLRQALEVISETCVTEHLHGSVRILASIVAMQTFELEALRFRNHRIHLTAAIALYQRILASGGNGGAKESIDTIDCTSTWSTMYRRLGPEPTEGKSFLRVPSPEQAALRFSLSSLLLSDVLSSMIFQEQPVLYDHHRELLDCDNDGSAVGLTATIGCENWVLLTLGQIAALDAWKQQLQREGNLDTMELVQRAMRIKDAWGENMQTMLEQEAHWEMQKARGLAVDEDLLQYSGPPKSQIRIISKIWAHAAHLYLLVVMSGWQPGSDEVRDSVQRITDLAVRKLCPKSLLRAVLWPVVVAGCLTEERVLEGQIRTLIQQQCMAAGRGIMREALNMLERVWGSRGAGDNTTMDLAKCFQSLGYAAFLM